MKPIKMFGFVALVALIAMAFVGASSAMAEGSTALCSVDQSPCPAGSTINHTHHELNSWRLVWLGVATCHSLFLGSMLTSGLGNPLVIHGTSSYSSCEKGCTVVEENGPSEIKVLRLGSELADWTFEGLIHVVCAGLNCRYNGVGLEGHVLGALIAANGTGEIVLSKQELNKESGIFCPASAFIEAEGAPLSETYISS